jgi:hypothetical protein
MLLPSARPPTPGLAGPPEQDEVAEIVTKRREAVVQPPAAGAAPSPSWSRRNVVENKQRKHGAQLRGGGKRRIVAYAQVLAKPNNCRHSRSGGADWVYWFTGSIPCARRYFCPYRHLSPWRRASSSPAQPTGRTSAKRQRSCRWSNDKLYFSSLVLNSFSVTRRGGWSGEGAGTARLQLLQGRR